MGKLDEEEAAKLKHKRALKKFVEWAESSTSHGFPNVFRAKSIVVKIIWALCFLVSTGFCSYLILTTILSYFQYETTTQIKIVQITKPYVFPSITLCNYNPFVTLAGRKHVYDSVIKTIGVNITNLSDKHKYNIKDLTLIKAINSIKLGAYSNSDNHTIKSYGYTVNDMIFECDFNNDDCNYTSDFDWMYHISYGKIFLII